MQSLLNQSYDDFDIYVSHGSENNKSLFKKHINKFKNSRVNFSVDIDNKYAFRRYDLARKLVDKYDIFLFLDDDVQIYNDYVKDCLAQYSLKSYQSSHAFSFLSDPPNYRDRKKYTKKSNYIYYCGAGMSMIDGSIFRDNNFFDSPIIKNNYQFDDIWLSYFCSKSGWSLNYLDSKAILNGDDNVALFKQIMSKKNDFLQILIKEGWKIDIDSNKN